MMAYVQELHATGDYPQLAALIAEHGLEPLWPIVSEHPATRPASTATSPACSTASTTISHAEKRAPPCALCA